MWSCHGNRHLVVSEYEPAPRCWIEVGSTNDAGCLVRDPVHAAGSLQRVHDIGESTALSLIQVGQDSGVEDNHRGA